jgi:Cys-tRNA(Pro)/Cys-tRNA(Cys) deacylase
MGKTEKLAKTNACRVLDEHGVRYELRAYDVDEEDLSAETVARKVGLPPEQVWKTLCVRGEKNGPLFCVLAGDQELDLKACARAAGDKSIEPVALKDLTPLTGYVRGGVTVLAAKKAFPVVVDEMMQLHDIISVSAGQRGLQILIAPDDYIRVTNAIVAPIARDKS